VIAALESISDTRFDPGPGVFEDCSAGERTTLEGEAIDAIFNDQGGLK